MKSATNGHGTRQFDSQEIEARISIYCNGTAPQFCILLKKIWRQYNLSIN